MQSYDSGVMMLRKGFQPCSGSLFTHLETLCCAFAVPAALQEAGHSIVPLYNQKRHFKQTFSPKLFRKETNLSHQRVYASGFQPAPRTVSARLRCDSSFLSKRGPVVFLQDTGLLNSKAEYANYLQPHAQSPQTLFSGKC